MRTHRLILASVAVFVLAGCTDQGKIDRLEASNKQLMATVAQLEDAQSQDYAQRMAAFDQAERHAAIAAGCLQLVNVCPKSITAPGVAALAAGHSGGGQFLFWLIYMGKLLFMAAMAGLALVLWTARLRPDLEAQRLADKALQSAQQALTDAQAATRAAEREQVDVQDQIEDSRETLASLDVDIRERTEAVEALDTAIARRKAALDALKGFKS